MVHAYDFNMEVPSTPSRAGVELMGLEEQQPVPFWFPHNNLDPDDESYRRGKRRRSSENSGRNTPDKVPRVERPDNLGSMVMETGAQGFASAFTAGLLTPLYGSRSTDAAQDYFSPQMTSNQQHGFPATPGLSYDAVGKVVLNSRLLKLRELLHEAVHDSLRTGGRPDFTKVSGTPHGERVTVEVPEAHSGEDERKHVEIEVIVDDNVPESMISKSAVLAYGCILDAHAVIVDGSYLTKMISSVFNNAFKFTPSGRITLNAAVDSFHQIVFTIVDTGDGIPSDFIPDLFKPFSTEDESLTRHRDGLGLGLYVARGIARKMGGDLWLERTATEGDNRGSEFRLRLPITPADASGSTPGTPVPIPTPGIDAASLSLRAEPSIPTPRHRPPSPLVRSVVAPPPVERKLSFDPELAKKLPLRILVVEDNRINRALLCSMLKRLGYNDISEARDGIEAVDIFSTAAANGRPFDLILMDLWMPRMDGYEAAERIQKLYDEQRSNGGELTVLAVSADATEEARAKAALKGIHGFVGKPFGIADLGKAMVDFRGERRVAMATTAMVAN